MAEKETNDGKARSFRTAKFVILIVLFALLLTGLVAFRDEITLENVRYLIKYLNFGSESTGEVSPIVYDADSSNRFEVYRGDLAVVNPSGLTLYEQSGKVALTDSFRMSNPTISVGDKYLLVYDLGGYNLRVYNSFSLLFEKNFNIIRCADINNNGFFSVATSEKGYHSAVITYNSDFKEISRSLFSDKFTADLSLSDGGNLTVATLRTTDSGTLTSDFVTVRTGTDDESRTVTREDEMPLLVGNAGNRTAFVLTDRTLYAVSGDKVNGERDLSEKQVEKCVFGDGVCAVTENELLVGVNLSLTIYDETLTPLLTRRFSTPVQDLAAEGKKVFVLTRDMLYILEAGKDERTVELDGEYTDVLPLSGETVLLCSDYRAIPRKIS